MLELQRRPGMAEGSGGERPAVPTGSQTSAIGLKVACDACGSRDNYIYPKATGFSPAFEVCCDRCGAVQEEGLDRLFFPEAIASFLERRDAFVKDTMPPDLDERVRRWARENDQFINPSRCTCGAHFSLAAKPRCQRCGAVILESYFHYVDEAPVEQPPQQGGLRGLGQAASVP